MENLRRNMAKDSRLKSIGRAYRAQKRWTVLLIGDLGEVVSFHLTKPLLLVSTACLAAILAVCIWSVVSYNSVRLANRKLTKDSDSLSTELEGAKRAREEALVRLMLLEDRVKQTAREAGTDTEQKTKDMASEPSELSPLATEGAKEGASEESKPAATAPQPTQTDRGKTAPLTTPARVSVENLEIWYEPEGNAFKFKFMVKNIDREGGKVAGYTFLVLKPKENLGEPLRAFPPTPLTNGKPSNFKDGHHFSIARYTYVRGTLTDISAINRFKSATVYTYSDTGNLLIEKVFEVG